MKILLIISMMSLISCGLNSRLFDNAATSKTSSAGAGGNNGNDNGDNGGGPTGPTTTRPDVNANVTSQAELASETKVVVLADGSRVAVDASVWNSDINLTDNDGNSVNSGKVRITLRNCNANQIYFNGDFLVGAFLNSDNPVETYAGLLDWNNDVQEYFTDPSQLVDGTSYGFDKKAWAQHVQANYPQLNIYNHFHKNSSGLPVDLCVDYRLDNGEGFSAPSTTAFLKSYSLSLDNDAIVDDESRQVNGRLRIGGPVFIDPAFITDGEDRALCSFERLRAPARAKLTHLSSYFKNGQWFESSASSTTYWDTVANFLGTGNYFEHVKESMPQPDPNFGQSCTNYIELFHVYTAVTDPSITRLRLSDGVDNSKFVEVELGVFESY